MQRDRRGTCAVKTRGSVWPTVSSLGDAAESEFGDEDIVSPGRTIRIVG